MASYYEQMYGMEPHHRGYLSSYQSILSFLIQSFLVGPLTTWIGGERRAAFYSTLLLAVATLFELQQSLLVFLMVLCPAISLSIAVLGISLQSLVTQVTPKDSLGSVLAALDVLQNATAVTVPFYRTLLFFLLGPGGEAGMVGDPDPMSWVVTSAVHWLICAVSIGYFLLSSEKKKKLQQQSKAAYWSKKHIS
jgi:putative exporter of polyketide antibiotics